MSKFDFAKFVSSPSVSTLKESVILKDDWIKLAKHYDISVRRYWRKGKVANEVICQLVEREVLEESAVELCEEESDDIALRKLELELEYKEREAERIMKDREAERKERERENEAERKERERENEAERKFQLEMLDKKKALGLGIQSLDRNNGSQFDIAKCCKLVPEFDEKDPEEFFLHFEKIAVNSKWPVDS